VGKFGFILLWFQQQDNQQRGWEIGDDILKPTQKYREIKQLCMLIIYIEV
jgi:hypothetical protein